MQKGNPKVIADVGRHHRTPWTLGVENKMSKGMKAADIGGIDEEINEKDIAKASNNHQRCFADWVTKRRSLDTNMQPQIY